MTRWSQRYRAQGVPFVLVTGYGEAHSSEPELHDAPRVDKPVDHQELVRALAHVLEAASPADSLARTVPAR